MPSHVLVNSARRCAPKRRASESPSRDTECRERDERARRACVCVCVSVRSRSRAWPLTFSHSRCTTRAHAHTCAITWIRDLSVTHEERPSVASFSLLERVTSSRFIREFLQRRILDTVNAETRPPYSLRVRSLQFCVMYLLAANIGTYFNVNLQRLSG